jgi:hypothetical protein
MKSFFVPCLALLAAYTIVVPAGSAEPVKHNVPTATSAECAAAQQLAKKTETGQTRIVYSGCRTVDAYSRNTTAAKMRAGAP